MRPAFKKKYRPGSQFSQRDSLLKELGSGRVGILKDLFAEVLKVKHKDFAGEFVVFGRVQEDGKLLNNGLVESVSYLHRQPDNDTYSGEVYINLHLRDGSNA